MNLPNAVKNQADAADEMIRQMANGNTEQPEIQGQPAPEKQGQPHGEQQAVDYEQRYKVLQGKYNAEVPVLRNQLNAMQAQLNQQKQSFTEQPRQEQPANMQEAITKFEADYGDEFKVYINAQVQAAMQPLNNRVNSFETNVKTLTHEQKCQQLADILRRDNIDLYTMDNSPDFHTFLNGIEPLSNQPRQTLLSNAFGAGEMERAAIFYREFNGSQQTQPTANNNPLEQHIQVPQADQGATGDPQSQNGQWTQAQINAFYTDLTANRIPPDDAARLEKSIFYAMQNGLVVG